MRWMAAVMVCTMLGGGGCFQLRPESRRSAVRIETSPPSALVQITDDTGTRSVGRSPAEVEVEYLREHQDWDMAIWLLPALTLGPAALVAGATAASGDPEAFSTAAAVWFPLGLIGVAALGVAIGCTVVDGDVIYEGYPDGAPIFTASLPGYPPTSRTLPMFVEPDHEATVSLSLLPLGSKAEIQEAEKEVARQ